MGWEDTRTFSPPCFIWERVSVGFRDRLVVPENKAKKCRIYYNNFPRPLLDDVIWEVAISIALSSLEMYVGCGNEAT